MGKWSIDLSTLGRRSCCLWSSKHGIEKVIDSYKLNFKTNFALIFNFNLRLILRALSATASVFWIGLNDTDVEGSWYWVNGEITVPSAVLWAPDQPDNNGNDEDCGSIVTDNMYGFGTNDGSCKNPHQALCEKQFNA